jgi:hypothetical protein
MKKILKICGLIIITNIIFCALVSLVGLQVVVLWNFILFGIKRI